MGIKDKIFADYNTVVNKINSLNFDNYLKKAQESVAASKEAEVNAANSAYNATKQNTQNEYNKVINDTKVAYESDYERNAVQKLINEKTVAEKNANLGLTDSGLNRTQQTAVQLSYANQKGDIDIARQSALNNLTLELTSAITKLETDRNSSILSINEKWNNYADNIAQTNYNNDLTAYNNQINQYAEQLKDIEQAEINAAADLRKAEINAAADLQKAQISSSASSSKSSKDTLLWYFTGTYNHYGNPIFRNSDGKTQAFGAGVNPYTGTKHKDAKYGTFSNGYQPNNIGGTKLKNSGIQTGITGKTQTVWYTEGKDAKGKIITKYWLWRGDLNQYVQLDISELGS